MKNAAAAPLPNFSGCLVEEALQLWGWGAPDKGKKRICDHLTAIALLKERGLKGSSIIGAYHVRRVVLLMACALLLYEMTPDTQLDGTMLVHEVLHNIEIAQRIKLATEAAPRAQDVVVDNLLTSCS